MSVCFPKVFQKCIKREPLEKIGLLLSLSYTIQGIFDAFVLRDIHQEKV